VRIVVGSCLVGFLANLAYSKYEKFTLLPIGKFIEVGEIVPPLNYYCDGLQNRNNNPIFIIPGSDSVYLPYGFLIKKLAEKHKVCTYDRHGRLFSGGKPNNTNVSFNIDSIHNLFKEAFGDLQKSEQVILIGHSLGGMLASAYALEYPQSVAGLVLLDSFGTSSKELVEQISIEPKEIASWTHVMTILGIVRAISIYDPYQYYSVVPYEWQPHFVHCINQPQYWTLDEISLWSPLRDFINARIEARKWLQIPVINIRSTKFGDRGDSLWKQLWGNETLLTRSITSNSITSTEIESDHTFLGKHIEVAKVIESFANDLHK